MTPSNQDFPDDFIWGAATASHQIEGHTLADGGGESVWSHFQKKPGTIYQDQTAENGPSSYTRYPQDVAALKWLGAQSYCFSTSWSRVCPNGDAQINQAGLDYYDKLVDALLADNITPAVTLFHWDMPQALEDRFGGWRSREILKPFADYCHAVVSRLSDRVTDFYSINEVTSFTQSAYGNTGRFAPGLVLPEAEVNQCRHHGVMAHFVALESARAAAKQPIKIGAAENNCSFVPIIATEDNIEAAKKALKAHCNKIVHPILANSYDPAWLDSLGASAPKITDADRSLMAGQSDFFGINMYCPVYVRANANQPDGYEELPFPEGYPKLDMPWLNVGPDIAYWSPRLIAELYGVDEIYISENGAACQDKLTREGEVLDTDRVFYLQSHLRALSRAVQEGVPVKGFLAWSLLDNFEWAAGFSKRFGLFYTNFQTGERIPKLSAEFMKETIRTNRVQ